VFAELSVFTSAFGIIDAAAICALDQPDAAAALDQLAERSLVLRAPSRRYVLLETLRAFGAEVLEEEGLAHEAHERHARHAIERIEAADRVVLDAGRETILFEVDAGLAELRNALDWLLDVGDVTGAARLVIALYDYGFLRLRPDVLWWADRVIAADPQDLNPLAPEVWTMSGLAAWMSGDLKETGIRAERAVSIVERHGRPEPSDVATMHGSQALFDGRLDEAIEHYGRARRLAEDDPPQRIVAWASQLLALAYEGDPRAQVEATALLAEVDGMRGPHAAYAWYCAGEAVLSSDVGTARDRLTTAIEMAEATGASFVRGVAGTSRASIEARDGDPAQAAEEFRLLLSHWRRAGMWSTQWTMLRSIAGLLETLGRYEESAVLTSAVLATQAGHRVFGDDEVALTQLSERLQASLGDEAYEVAAARGRVLDGPAAVEHALQSL
jgi:tetratricopeptide (TPR) repeat protein